MPAPVRVRLLPAPLITLLIVMPPVLSMTTTLSVALPKATPIVCVAPLARVKDWPLLFRRITFGVPLIVTPAKVKTPGAVPLLFVILNAVARADVTSMAPTLWLPPLLPMLMPTVVPVGLAPNCATSPGPGIAPPVQFPAVSQAELLFAQAMVAGVPAK